MNIAKELVKLFLPVPARRFLKEQYHEANFRAAMKKFIKDPVAALSPGSGVIGRLIRGWGNEGWSTGDEYAVASMKHALECDGDILECGSGLSTIMLGVLAEKRGKKIWSLEHHAGLGKRVQANLDRYGLHSVSLCVAPLKDYGGYSWYDPPLNAMPQFFSLVICDGPPGETRGGRYGMVPVIRKKLKNGSVILLDDGAREGEQAVARRWSDELGAPFHMHGTEKPYIRLVVPE